MANKPSTDLTLDFRANRRDNSPPPVEKPAIKPAEARAAIAPQSITNA